MNDLRLSACPEQKKLLTGLCDKSTNTLEEPSEMISTNEAAHKLEPNVASDGSPTTQEDPRKEPDLQKQLGAMVEVLKNSDEVDQLVLRNTGLTDTLLQDLADALKSSLSEVTMINLNLNHIGPSGVNTLLELIRSKPHLKSLFIFGNQLGDSGVQALLLGLAELQYKTIWATEAPSQSEATPAATVEPQLPAFTGFSLRELDLGGNSMGGAGLRVLATYLRRHSQLQYLGLGQTSDPDGAAWADLFDSLKANAHLAHIILDECGLGDHGVKLFAEALKASMSLSKVDLDGNGIAESGGNAILEALVSRRHSPLQHLSIEEGNYITTALMMKILQEMNRLAPL
ncbi:nucleotide-binding oligomerization domain-containing protein 2 [Denticeps clupeoides]|uniref:nucleotide-binding oligomerization domain-containing protein 2 n=1 Tax=Denticeps clupeoides TaxID=299321 RepID=UPI0010A56A3E|nr:nucleotide-binding oligomerization domain-containing protein 2-like [Denticeps clupeoides]